jgi:hypothetical protein
LVGWFWDSLRVEGGLGCQRRAWMGAVVGDPYGARVGWGWRPKASRRRRGGGWNGNQEVRYPKGRVTFAGAEAAAPFPVAIVIFRPKL